MRREWITPLVSALLLALVALASGSRSGAGAGAGRPPAPASPSLPEPSMSETPLRDVGTRGETLRGAPEEPAPADAAGAAETADTEDSPALAAEEDPLEAWESAWWNRADGRLLECGCVGDAQPDVRTSAGCARSEALRWLASHQQENGYWDADGFAARCKLSVCDGRGAADADVAVTALALLAFLEAGNTHFQGRYKDQVREGLKFLVQHQAPSGSFAADHDPVVRADHALATLTMLRGSSLTAWPLFRRSVPAALDHHGRAPAGTRAPPWFPTMELLESEAARIENSPQRSRRAREEFRRWAEVLLPTLAGVQRTEGDQKGSCDPVGPDAGLLGRVGTTALYALALDAAAELETVPVDAGIAEPRAKVLTVRLCKLAEAGDARAAAEFLAPGEGDEDARRRALEWILADLRALLAAGAPWFDEYRTVEENGVRKIRQRVAFGGRRAILYFIDLAGELTIERTF